MKKWTRLIGPGSPTTVGWASLAQALTLSVYVSICRFIYMSACMNTYISYTYVYIYMYSLYIYIYTCIILYIMHIVYMCMCIYMYIYIYVKICICSHFAQRLCGLRLGHASGTGQELGRGAIRRARGSGKIRPKLPVGPESRNHGAQYYC